MECACRGSVDRTGDRDVIEYLLWLLMTLPMPLMAVLLLAENFLVFALALWFGGLLMRRYRDRAVCEAAAPIEPLEVALALTTVVINTAVTIVGLWLWRVGWVRFRPDVDLRIVKDLVALTLAMDFLMYWLHRVAHTPLIYRILHRTHHRYDHPRPLTLFVLHPFETVSFGLLWLLVIMVYQASWVGMSLYLVLNVAFGAVGHLGVEPFPRSWIRIPLVSLIATSTFHSEHHADAGHNFGFYTLIWDRLFGTLAPRYEADFIHGIGQ